MRDMLVAEKKRWMRALSEFLRDDPSKAPPPPSPEELLAAIRPAILEADAQDA